MIRHITQVTVQDLRKYAYKSLLLDGQVFVYLMNYIFYKSNCYKPRIQLRSAIPVLTQPADDSPYNHPSVIRALFTVLNYVRIPKKQNKLSIEEKQAQNLAAGKPINAGLAWTEELKQEVAALFREGKSIDELSQHFERTEGAILSVLVHQGIIEQDEKQNYR